MTDLYYTRSLKIIGEQFLTYEGGALAVKGYGPTLSTVPLTVPDLGDVIALAATGLDTDRLHLFQGGALGFDPARIAFATPPLYYRTPDRSTYYIVYAQINAIPGIPRAAALYTYEVYP